MMCFMAHDMMAKACPPTQEKKRELVEKKHSFSNSLCVGMQSATLFINGFFYVRLLIKFFFFFLRINFLLLYISWKAGQTC